MIALTDDDILFRNPSGRVNFNPTYWLVILPDPTYWILPAAYISLIPTCFVGIYGSGEAESKGWIQELMIVQQFDLSIFVGCLLSLNSKVLTKGGHTHLIVDPIIMPSFHYLAQDTAQMSVRVSQVSGNTSCIIVNAQQQKNYGIRRCQID